MGFLGDAIGAVVNYNTAKQNLASQEKWNERNLEFQRQANAENLAFQKEGLEWQKGEANLTREREDTAIRRRVADLQAANLNPLLAAGSPASASTPISSPVVPRVESLRGSAPQSGFKMKGNFSVLDSIQTAQALRLGAANVSRTETENLLLKERARSAAAEADIAELDRDIARSAPYDENAPGRGTLRGYRTRFETNLVDEQAVNMAARTAETYADTRKISADTAKVQLETAIRDRDFAMLKEFGIMDDSGVIGQKWADLLSLKNNIPEQVGNNLRVLRDALGGLWNNLFKND